MKKKVIETSVLVCSRLQRKFYTRNTLTVAKNLLGKYLVRNLNGNCLIGKIVETEAYTGDQDSAAHSFNGLTKRNSVMFSGGGFSYVYFIYGNHYCFNVTTGQKNIGHAVLIRAVEPVEGIELMMKFRQCRTPKEISNGPGKLTRAFCIDNKFNGVDVTESDELYITHVQDEKFLTAVSERIGIKKAVDYPFRFFIKDNPFVSPHKFNTSSKTLA